MSTKKYGNIDLHISSLQDYKYSIKCDIFHIYIKTALIVTDIECIFKVSISYFTNIVV